jgi:signal peptidase I
MITKKIGSLYTLSKSKKVLRQMLRLYRQKKNGLDLIGKERIQSLLTGLQTAIFQKNAQIAGRMAHQLEDTSRRLMPKTTWDKLRDFVGAIGFALLVAIAIRQMLFEFYTIPSGSMRPTLKEGDFLVVSKSDFGINTPLRSGHFYFDPTLVMRGSVVIFGGENMDMPDDDTMHFYVFPGKKQYIKRLVGKPGDTLYFYGGEIFGVNGRGRELNELQDPDHFSIEHIPYIRFEGKVESSAPSTQGIYPSVVLYQMNQPVTKLSVNRLGQVSGEMIPQKGQPLLKQFSDLWGFGNYAMTRLLTKEQAEKLHPGATQDLEPATLYLEINHHPSLSSAHLLRDEQGRIRPGLGYSTSLFPLAQEHLDELMHHITTCRFEVKNGHAFRNGYSNPTDSFAPELPGVPDGTYEIQDGVVSKVLWGGVVKHLPSNHPLYHSSLVQTLYNLGFEWHTYFEPSLHAPLPSRYAYFRSGDLCLVGAPIVKKGDPRLTLFLKREYQKQSISTSVKPYLPFDDAGPPFTEEGTLDIDFVKKHGLTIPDKMYLVMGDNHAMSADSRQFGFVPQDNLRGGASFLFWPAGSRWGALPQAIASHLTLPNLLLWTLTLSITFASYLYIQRKFSRPLTFDK